jgi:preprotein translocase subunit SecE
VPVLVFIAEMLYLNKIGLTKKKRMNKIANYFKESYIELQEKVTWPTWANLQQSTVIVLVATIIITAIVWVMDFSSNQLLKLIYSLFK